MNVTQAIATIDELNEDAVIYARRVAGQFTPSSEIALLVLDEAEADLHIAEIAQRHCAGFEYFLEIFIIRDLIEDFTKSGEYNSFEQLVERIIYYAEFDA